MRRRLAIVVTLGSLAWLAPESAPAQVPVSPAPYAPLVQGWQQFFDVTWEPVARKGRSFVAGYVANTGGFPARRVQLLVDGLDASGRTVSQSVAWMGGELPPGIRAYFEVPAPQPGVTYRVSVFAFDWVQTAAIQAP